MFKILETLSDFYGAGHHRAIFPANYLNSHNDGEYEITIYAGGKNDFGDPFNVINVIEERKDWPTFCNDYDVLNFSRLCTYPQLKMIEKVLEKCDPTFTIWHCDDDIFSLPAYNPAHPFYNAEKQKNAFMICSMVDRICVVSENCKESFLDFGFTDEKIVVVPNTLHKKFYPVKKFKPKDENRKLKIIWFGSGSYGGDFHKLIIPLMIKLDECFDVEFHISNVFSAKYVPADFWNGTEHLDIKFFEFVHPQMVGTFLRDNDFDFGIHLMHDNTFNRCRSSSKNKEMLFSGAMLPLTYIEHKSRNGYINKIENPSVDYFVDYVREMLDNDKYHKELRKLRKRWYGKLWLEDNVSNFEKLYGIDVLRSGVLV